MPDHLMKALPPQQINNPGVSTFLGSWKLMVKKRGLKNQTSGGTSWEGDTLLRTTPPYGHPSKGGEWSSFSLGWHWAHLR